MTYEKISKNILLTLTKTEKIYNKFEIKRTR